MGWPGWGNFSICQSYPTIPLTKPTAIPSIPNHLDSSFHIISHLHFFYGLVFQVRAIIPARRLLTSGWAVRPRASETNGLGC